ADKHSTGTGKARFVSVQNEYSLLHREPEAEVLPECERLGIALIPYWPLASGLLTGKYHRGEPAPAGTRLATASGRFAEFLSDENLARVEARDRKSTRLNSSHVKISYAVFCLKKKKKNKNKNKYNMEVQA